MSFPRIFDEIVAATPDAVAVEYLDHTLTYRELDAHAARITSALRDHGIGRGDVVGVSARPSQYLPAAMLGIVRAGAAWLPLDPSYPEDRLRYMAADAGIRLLVGDPGVDPAADVEVLSAADPGTAAGTSTEVTSADTAYVIYTSGSTGRPKGVAVTHGGLANLITAQAETFGVGPGDRVLQFAPTSFDASVFEIVMALATGATLVLAPRDDLGPGPALADLLAHRHISHLTVPPSVLATLPEPGAARGAALPDLRVLVCAGEALPAHLVAAWQPGRRMFNAYGPTETTVWATVAEVSAGATKPTIGAAIHGATAAVVDEQLHPLPPGSPGELLVGGLGVAHGYLDRPGLTARRFVPDPAGRPGSRRYRTGDLVVAHEDGALEFLGRVDNQVKIRGIRIEPEEVTSVLAGHPSVTDAVVVARDLGRGAELHGYVTGDADPDTLRAWLRDRVPDHLVPATVTRLATLPLTPSGKVDRDALPAPVSTGPADYTAPVTPTEEALAAFLAELLGLARVGRTDEFFALGGTSLLAGRLAAKVRVDLGRELSLPAIYRGRTVAGMAALLDTGTTPEAVPPVPTTTGDEPAPLSFPQERVWFLEKLAPGNLAYNAQATIRLRGQLDADVLRATLTEIVRRHEVFRCAFTAEGGAPSQRPVPPMPVELPLHDLTDAPDDDERTERIVVETVREPFVLDQPPLARWALIRHAQDDHTLVHVEHHMVHDGWSFALFLRELQAIYPALSAGGPPPPPPAAARYTDFARWQRDWISGPVLDAGVAHWLAELSGCQTVLDLPTDRPRPRGQSFRGDALRVQLPAALCERLRDYARARGVTLYSTLLTGFATVLARHSGQYDIVIGSGVANRRLAELESLIGMVVNTLPLRVNLTGAPSFDEAVAATHAGLGRAGEWPDVPLERLVDAMNLPRDPSRNPLFQVMFNAHDSAVPDVDFAGITGAVLERHNGSAKTDINIVVIPRAEQRAGRAVTGESDPITLIWEYATDLFDAATMRALVTRFTTVLTEAMADPTARIDRLPLLGAGERAAVVAASSGPANPYPAERTIGELFAEQVAARPDAEALVHGEVSLTYRELDDRATRIARVLAHRGVSPDVPVGVLLERGADLVVALLAVIKAGGAYVPLDPGYPAERLAAMVADVDTPVVVTRAGLDGLVDVPAVVMIDNLPEVPDTPANPPRPGNLAYILFTSGSTGRPKGVEVEHRSVLRLVFGADYAGFGPGERFAQVADASFDALTFELWGALLHGGAVCVIDTDTLLTAGGLRTALRTTAVTQMFLTSALFTEVMADHPDTFAGMTTLMVGGDALNAGRVRKLLDQPADRRPARLVNGYGPTETTTFAVCHHIEALPADAPGVPIGRPIANTTGYVLDRHLAPVPDGVAGELYLGGPGVARGYAGRPGLTAQRFLPDPFAGDGSRMYRTGDLVRYRDGVVEFLGRADNQVKIRGFRVEPGEVEAVLGEHPGVAQASVVVDDHPSGKRLVAYVVPTGSDPTDLRDYLASRLPPYLLPSAYVVLAALPMTASGKVDRAALPPVDDTAVVQDGYREPGTDTERVVAGLVSELLGGTRVGADDDFFRLGGHSLLAMRLVARANENYATEVPLRRFLLAPTVSALAKELDAARGGAATATETESTEQLLERLDQMSADEIERLLATTVESEIER